jgi:hypothetical protein
LEKTPPKAGSSEVKTNGKNVQETARRKTKVDKQQSIRSNLLEWDDDGEGGRRVCSLLQDKKHQWREKVPTLQWGLSPMTHQ